MIFMLKDVSSYYCNSRKKHTISPHLLSNFLSNRGSLEALNILIRIIK